MVTGLNGIKELTAESWLESDPLMKQMMSRNPFSGEQQKMTREDWSGLFLAHQLHISVPVEIRRLYSVAQSALLYGLFYYPLITLGTEQLLRVVETSIIHICQQKFKQAKKPTFYSALTNC